MRAARLVLLMAFSAVAAGFAACDRTADDIAAVRVASSILPGTTNDVLMLTVAGPRGKIDWQASPGENGTVVVAALIDRLSGSSTRHKLEFDFIHNPQTAQVTFDGVRVDGQAKLPLAASGFNQFMLQLE
jgi:hypothetical protein